MTTMAGSTAPILLQATSARIAVDDVVTLDRLTWATSGMRVLLLGYVEPLMSLLLGNPSRGRPLVGMAEDTPAPPSGSVRLLSGSLLCFGEDVAAREHLRLCGLAPLDPPLPPELEGLSYVRMSAELGGAEPRTSRALAEQAIEGLGLESLVGVRMGGLNRSARRAFVLAQAIALRPQVLIVQNPFLGLDTAEASFVGAALEAAGRERATLISSGPQRLGSPGEALFRGVSDLLHGSAEGHLLHVHAATAMPAAELWWLEARGDVGAFEDALRSYGYDLSGGPSHFLASAPPLGVHPGPRSILRAAADAGVALLGLKRVLGP